MLRDGPSRPPQHEVNPFTYRRTPHAEERHLARLEAWAVSLDQRRLVLLGRLPFAQQTVRAIEFFRGHLPRQPVAPVARRGSAIDAPAPRLVARRDRACTSRRDSAERSPRRDRPRVGTIARRWASRPAGLPRSDTCRRSRPGRWCHFSTPGRSIPRTRSYSCPRHRLGRHQQYRPGPRTRHRR